MTQREIIADFQRMLSEKWEYVLSSSSPGAVDCSGAFVWSYGQHGKSIFHGSNRILRTEIVALLPIDRWKPGMAAFKRRTPGQQGYALPESYQPGGKHYNGDLNDYYHIGLVDDGGGVLNAQSSKTGFVRSKLDGSWCGVGYLKQVDYGEVQQAISAVVTAPSGSNVRMRKNPSEKAETLRKIPLGERVSVYGTSREWSCISYEGISGYMLSAFLEMEGETSPREEEKVELLLDREDALRLQTALADALLQR